MTSRLERLVEVALNMGMSEGHARFYAARALEPGAVTSYVCPVCKVADEFAYLGCNRPDCTDGRDPR